MDCRRDCEFNDGKVFSFTCRFHFTDVAVTGLPEPQENHAIIMAKFARECLDKLYEVTHELEITLGPDTGDLSMRVG